MFWWMWTPFYRVGVVLQIKFDKTNFLIHKYFKSNHINNKKQYIYDVSSDNIFFFV